MYMYNECWRNKVEKFFFATTFCFQIDGGFQFSIGKLGVAVGNGRKDE
jgi:hypothetical protein